MKKTVQQFSFAFILIFAFVTSARAQIISNFAGSGTSAYTGDNGQANQAALYGPGQCSVDAAGNVYVADTYNHVIRKITPIGIITTIAGTGTSGYNGEGTATACKLNYPIGVAVDASGNVYISDDNNFRIRKVTTGGIISTFAGTGISGYNGDGIAATTATIATPRDIAVDASGNVFFAEYSNHRVRKITVSTGIITTVAGDGSAAVTGDGGLATAAGINTVQDIAFDPSGNLYLADNVSNTIRKVVLGGNITTIAGTGTAGFSGDGGAATLAQLYSCRGICFDATGNLFFVDDGNFRIRKINSGGIISTIAGSSSYGNTGDGGPAANATLASSRGMTYNAVQNKIYFIDQTKSKVRVISPNNGIYFDGTNDYISVPHNNALKLNSDFTIEAWVNPSSAATSKSIVSKGNVNGTNPGDKSYCFQLDANNTISMYIEGFGFKLSTVKCCAGQWNHVAVTYNTAVQELRFYVNGVYTNTVSGITYPPNPNVAQGETPEMRIGVQGSGSSACGCNFFNGSMDELRMWNVTRTAAEINNNKNKELLGNESGLIAYYNFDNAIASGANSTQTFLRDATIAANHGTLNNFTRSGATSNWIAGATVIDGGCSNTANIKLSGNQIAICNGSASPVATNFTNYGNISMGSKQTKAFLITNPGSSALSISSINFTGTNASEFSTFGSAFPINVNPGNGSVIYVECNPVSTGTKNATLVINSNDCANAVYNFALQATVCTPSLATSGDNKTDSVLYTTNFLQSGTCRMIADVQPTLGPNALIGNTTAKVTVDGSVQTTVAGSPYVQRHYDIEPSVNAANAKGRVTLYFTQAEFNAYNAHPAAGQPLPTNSADAAGIANLRVTQYHGTGTAPGNYTGTAVLINPADADIVYETAYSRWKVTFDVTGFSGFYIHTGFSVLTVSLISFNGIHTGGYNQLRWITANEINNAYFELERSTNGTTFNKVNTIASQGNGSTNKTYSYNDDVSGISAALYYYRLKVVDINGRFSYSNIVKLNNRTATTVSISPNPVKNMFTINFTDNNLLNTYAFLTDVQGRKVQQIMISNYGQQVSVDQLAGGMYFLQLQTGETVIVIKK